MSARENLERDILLAGSGELPASEREALARALAADPEGAAWQRDASRLQALAREALSCEAPSAAVVDRIRAAAGAQVRRRALWVLPPAMRWAPVYAAAAALAIALGVALLLPAPRNRIAEVGAILAMTVGDDHVDRAADLVSEDSGDLQDLGRLLLQMEGFTADAEADAATTDVEQPPTALQQHSIPVPPARIYG